ncbi:hypothetical protein [Atopomonas sediminilitoris]|uniref:hypothetical protein n=1 Tax=Atopomonas sediminilitoris TaxID=2919919 RepID=UPI001F4D90C0|nr:hypothetical protein [Atopomonas sediminilitoris]MCJ8169129.1 hypothetical protein [Atopomonas sediminilitoris]
MTKFASEIKPLGVQAGPWSVDDLLPAAFATLPQQLYSEDPHWLGEDPLALAHAFSRHNPWFAEPNAQAWLGVVPGQARLAGFYNAQQVDGQRVAFFGYWEGIDDSTPHAILFNELRAWARRQGATRLYGPINFSTFGAYRLRVDGFEHGCFPGEPWNLPYYPALLSRLGFNERYRYLSTSTACAEVASEVAQGVRALEAKLAPHVRISGLDGAFWLDNLDAMYGFVDGVFGANFAYRKPSMAQFSAQCGRSFAERLCPHSSVVAQTHDGRIAGFFLVFPDYAPLYHQFGITQPKFAEHFDRLPLHNRHALAKTGGVLPEMRELGLFTAMSGALSLRAAPHYARISACLVRADNHSKQFALRHGTASQRHYALYQQDLAP